MNVSAKTISEVHILSALLEKSITCTLWFKKQQNKFYLMANAFEPLSKQKSNVMIIINNVNKVFQLGDFDNEHFFYILALLCIANNQLGFVFSHEKRINIYIDNIDIEVHKLTESWSF